MNCDRSFVHGDALRRAEGVYRSRLVSEPADTEIRLRLAWCLFLQALHQAGRESAALPLVSPMEAAESGGEGLAQQVLNQYTRDLLRECLRETNTVLHLSTRPHEHHDVAHLRNLVCLSGGGEAVSEAEADGLQILVEISREFSRAAARTDADYRRLRYRRRTP